MGVRDMLLSQHQGSRPPDHSAARPTWTFSQRRCPQCRTLPVRGRVVCASIALILTECAVVVCLLDTLIQGTAVVLLRRGAPNL